MDQKQGNTPADALVTFLNALITARDSRSIDELRESVQSMVIDPDRLVARAREQVTRAREQARLSWVTRAHAMLPQIRERLREAPTGLRPNRDEQVRRVREAIEGVFGEHVQEFAAAFRKFEYLPDKDLVSLVEDIEALRLLEGESGDERP